MKTKDLVDFIKDEIKKIDISLEGNSWDYCDDDESPDFEQRGKDHAQKDAYMKVLNFINKELSTIYDKLNI
jgi:hypothetical protein